MIFRNFPALSFFVSFFIISFLTEATLIKVHKSLDLAGSSRWAKRKRRKSIRSMNRRQEDEGSLSPQTGAARRLRRGVDVFFSLWSQEWQRSWTRIKWGVLLKARDSVLFILLTGKGKNPSSRRDERRCGRRTSATKIFVTSPKPGNPFRSLIP